MPPTASIFSNKSVKKVKDFFKPKGKKNESSNFHVKSTYTETPAPIKTEPSPRETKAEERKAEVKASDQKKADAIVDKDEKDLEISTAAIASSSNDKGKAKADIVIDVTPAAATKTQQAVTTTRVSTKGPYAALVKHENTLAPNDVVYSIYSRYTPNFISISESLAVGEQAISGNTRIDWTEKKYLSLPFRYYITVMYYVTILNVKESLRMNKPKTSTWLRKFNRDFEPKGLPLPGYLVPQFAAIAAYQIPDDDRVSWLYPDVPDDIGTRMNSVHEEDESYRLTQPHASQLFDIISLYCADTTAFPMTPANTYTYNGNAIFMPTQTATHLGGKEFTVAYQRHQATNLANPAMTHPLPESRLSLMDRRRVWQNSFFRPNPLNPRHTDAHHDYPDIPSFLRLDESTIHFSEAVAVAKIHCSFFEHSTNFASIDYSSGPEIGIFSDLQFYYNPRTATAVADASLPDLTTVRWYPEMTRAAHADIYHYEDGINLMCFLVAKHCLMNSRLTFRFRTTVAGAAATQTVVALPRADRQGYRARVGPWFNSDADGNRYDDGPFSTIWKRTYNYNTEVLSGREDFIRSEFYKPAITF